MAKWAKNAGLEQTGSTLLLQDRCTIHVAGSGSSSHRLVSANNIVEIGSHRPAGCSEIEVKIIDGLGTAGGGRAAVAARLAVCLQTCGPKSHSYLPSVQHTRQPCSPVRNLKLVTTPRDQLPALFFLSPSPSPPTILPPARLPFCPVSSSRRASQ